MENTPRHFPVILCFTFLAGCGGGGDDPPTTKVYKNRGSLFCGTKGVPPDVMLTELTSVNVPVRSFACGIDGLGRNGQCGTVDGAINIFEIPASELAKAQMLAFRPFAELLPPERTPLSAGEEIPCPPA